MRISRLKIQGFRTVNRGFDCTLNDLAIFVGRNNAGKSCAVRALDLFFNHSKKPDSFIPHIRVNPSSDKKTRYSIIIGVWVDDVSQSIRRKYRPYMNKEGQLPIRLYYSPKDGSVVYSGFRAGKFSTTKSNGDKLESISKSIMLSDKTLRISFEDINREYALQYFRSWTGRQEIMSRSTGNQDSMRNIGQDRIRSICLPICSREEMDVIMQVVDAYVSDIDNQHNLIDESLLKSQALRQSILKKAFSGKLVPQDSNDEPASELLKRIAKEKAEIAAQLKDAKATTKKAKKKINTTKKKVYKKVKTV